MDKNVTINNQMVVEDEENKNGGSVILINKFDVAQDKIEQFLKDWAEKFLITLNNNLDL